MSVYRVDFGTVRNVVRTPVGGLRVNAAVTRSGVLTYKDQHGKEWRELRPESEVFKADSLGTLPGAAVTDGHPDKLVTPETFRAVNRGHVDGAPERDEDLVVTPLAINDGELVRAVDAGERKDVSAGYTCDLEEAPGVHNGERYDRVQRNIRYNHVALLPPGAGRAGERVSLRMDGAAQQVLRLDAADAKDSTVKTVTLAALAKTYRLDDAGDLAAMDKDVTAQVSKKDADNAKMSAALEAAQKALLDAFGEIGNLKAQMAAMEPDGDEAMGDEADETEAQPEEVLDSRKALRLVARLVLPSGTKLKGMRADAVRSLVQTSVDKTASDRATEIAKVRADALKVLAEADIKDKSVGEIRKLTLAKLAPTVKLDSFDEKAIAGMFEASIAAAKPVDASKRRDDSARSNASINETLNRPRTDAEDKSADRAYEDARKEAIERGRKPLNGSAT